MINRDISQLIMTNHHPVGRVKTALRHLDHDILPDHKNVHPNCTLHCGFLRRNPCLINYILTKVNKFPPYSSRIEKS